MKVDFIDRHKDEHGVQLICDALAETSAAIAPSSYYAAESRPPSARSLRDAELMAAITTMCKESYHVYGARKMWKEIGRAGHQVARCTVERLMRAEGLKGSNGPSRR
ncbi:IS3 family transposase [Dietzia lutea]|uniref:IS3 family transposase n=1 Tax=Dietzia lutea TaxID=546160 RepID=UPI000D560B3A|nr:IS3 family transposase [Dietzia lutea]